MNKYILAIAAAVFALSSYDFAYAAPGQDERFERVSPIERYEVADDGGGSVEEFQQGLKFISKTGLGMKVDGYCASACTLLLSTVYKLDVCITSKAKFMFHKPFMARMGPLGDVSIVKTIPSILRTEKMWREDFYKVYPEWVKTEIDKNGGVPSVYTGSQPSEMFTIGFDTLKKNMVVCND